MSLRAEYTAQELAELTGMHRFSVAKRAEARGWGFREQPNANGGKPSKLYLSASMDAEFLRRLAAAGSDAPGACTSNPDEKDIQPHPPSAPPPAILPDAASAPAPVDANRRALARADLVRAYGEAVKAAGRGGRNQARELFVEAYNTGAPYPLIYELLGEVKSWRTIESWRTRAEAGGCELLDRRGRWRRGCRLLSQEQQEIVLRCALNPNKPRVSEAIRIAKAVMASRGVANGHSERTYRRFLTEWRRKNLHLWTYTREGKSAWNDQCALSIERDYEAIEVGDLIVADGHTLNFEILSPWTGKPKRMALILWYDMKSNYPLGWEIMPTENTAAIAAGLRRAILRLGKIPKAAYMDNGRAFASRFFNGQDLSQAGISGLFQRLGIHTMFAWPYHGQSKTVERFFGTFAELERMCPTYTGTSIADKPPRLNRGESLHRRLHARMTGGAGITMEQAHRAIAAWFDDYAQRPQRGHLAGRTPLEVFLEGRGPGVNKLDLVYLMMAEESRTITRSGISFFGRTYYDPALYGRAHACTVRYDLQDPSSIYVFEPDGEFICEARPLAKVHPAAALLGDEEDKRRLVEHIRVKKDQERQASAFAREFLAEEVLPEHNLQLARMGIVESRLEAAPTGKRKEPPALPAPMSPEEERRFAEEVARLAAGQAEMKAIEAEIAAGRCAEECAPEVENEAAELRSRLMRMSEIDRYETLLDMDVQGLLMIDEWRAFMAYFELTEEYERHRAYFEERRLKLAAAVKR